MQSKFHLFKDVTIHIMLSVPFAGKRS